MIGFNLSVDFELGWGDLGRVARDDSFYRHAIQGTERTLDVLDMLERAAIPSTWAVVGGCCCGSLDEVQAKVPRAFAAVRPALEQLQRLRPDHGRVLFCRSVVDAVVRNDLVEVGSHGFLHLIPTGLPAAVLQEDVAASVQQLEETCGRSISSFVPPQNHWWPKEAFAQTSIRYVRHSPAVYGRPYSGRGIRTKLLRLGSDVWRPAHQIVESGEQACLIFLRIDRGSAVWRIQLRTLESLFRRRTGAVYCFTHPHNLHGAAALERLGELCDLVRKYRDRGALEFRPFVRNLDRESRAAAN